MRILLTMLMMAFAVSSAHAVTFIYGNASYDFGDVREGETRNELLVYDISRWNYVRQLEPSSSWQSIEGIVSATRYNSLLPSTWSDGRLYLYSDSDFGGPSRSVDLSLEDCGAYSAPGHFCVRAQFTSTFEGIASNGTYWDYRWNVVGTFEDGSRRLLWGNSFYNLGSDVSFTPVPVPLPAALPLMMGALSLLALRSRRKRSSKLSKVSGTRQ